MVAESETPVRLFASPLARRLAQQAGLTLADIVPTGPNERVVRRDVELAAAHASAERAIAVSVASFVDRPHTRIRRADAARLSEGTRTAPHLYLRGSARVDALAKLRDELNDGSSPRVSVTDLMVKAVAHTHQRVPAMNVIWMPHAVREYSSVDIAVSVATAGGLVTPVLRSVEHSCVRTVARQLADLSDRARCDALQQRELEGGTITVTNLGMYGTEEFAAIIHPPHAAILAVGAARTEAVVDNGGIAVRTVLRMTLSVDPRPVDGATAATWMSTLVDLLEHPVRILD